MELITSLFSGPVLPATCLLLLMMVWSGLAVLGTVDLDLPSGDIDLDVDLDVETDLGVGGAAADSLGVLAMRWLNIQQVPLVIWVGVFSVLWWLFSALLWTWVDRLFFEEGASILWSSILAVRNIALALPATKLATNPMRAWFADEQLNAQTLIGAECEISSLQASPDFGQVKFKTEGAPLLLNVRTDGPHLARGARVWITHYDSKNHVYVVSPTGSVSNSESSENREEE